MNFVLLWDSSLEAADQLQLRKTLSFDWRFATKWMLVTYQYLLLPTDIHLL